MWVDALDSDGFRGQVRNGSRCREWAVNLSERKDLASVPKPSEAIIFKEGQPCHPYTCATPLLDSLSLAS